MKLLIAGSSVKDYIHKGAETLTKPGGIYYSAKGLIRLIQTDDDVFILTSISAETEELFASVYLLCNNEYITRTEKIPTVHLTIFDDKERHEQFENMTKKLDVSIIDNSKIFDGILINMISGFDFSLEDMQVFRNKTKGPVYFDLHSLSRGIDFEGNRISRPVPDIEKWLSYVDILQVNENEILTINNSLCGDYEKDKQLAILKVLKSGVKYIVLTMGENGAGVYWLEEGEMMGYTEPAYGGKLLTPVGCGDVFGSAFFYSYLQNGGNQTESLKSAIRAAGSI